MVILREWRVLELQQPLNAVLGRQIATIDFDLDYASSSYEVSVGVKGRRKDLIPTAHDPRVRPWYTVHNAYGRAPKDEFAGRLSHH